MSSASVSAARALIVADDRDLLAAIGVTLNNAGYHITTATTGSEALAIVERSQFSLVVLDVNMPAPNGLEVCKAMRRRSNVPVLMLSARDREEDLLSALEAGADSYITKPFSARTLVARAHALVRRTAPGERRQIQVRNFRLDSNEYLLVCPGGSIPLTRLETRVLRLLMTNAGATIDPDDLMSDAWRRQKADRNMLKQVVFRLRKKLLSYDVAPVPLKTTDGGYMWCVEAEPGASSTTIPLIATPQLLENP